jgi:hypothetical protein
MRRRFNGPANGSEFLEPSTRTFRPSHHRMGFCKPSLKVGFRLTARLKGLILKACDGAPLDRGSTRQVRNESGCGLLFPRRPRCPISSARFTTARTATDGCSVAMTMDVFSSYTKPTCLPAERRPKSSSETFSAEARRAPSIKRLPG